MKLSIEYRAVPYGKGIQATILESPHRTVFGMNITDAMKLITPLVEEYAIEYNERNALIHHQATRAANGQYQTQSTRGENFQP